MHLEWIHSDLHACVNISWALRLVLNNIKKMSFWCISTHLYPMIAVSQDAFSGICAFLGKTTLTSYIAVYIWKNTGSMTEDSESFCQTEGKWRQKSYDSVPDKTCVSSRLRKFKFKVTQGRLCCHLMARQWQNHITVCHWKCTCFRSDTLWETKLSQNFSEQNYNKKKKFHDISHWQL